MIQTCSIDIIDPICVPSNYFKTYNGLAATRIVHISKNNKTITDQGCEISMTIEQQSMTIWGDIGPTPANSFDSIAIVFRKGTGCH